MHWLREGVVIYQVPELMGLLYYPGGGGRQRHRGSGEGGRVKHIFLKAQNNCIGVVP